MDAVQPSVTGQLIGQMKEQMISTSFDNSPALINAFQSSASRYVFPARTIHHQIISFSISSIPRSTFIILSQADFPQIFDRNAEPPTLIDPSSSSTTQQSFNLNVELNDRLDSHEIIFQFLAISRQILKLRRDIYCCYSPPDVSYVDANLPQRVFFTFQFYRFPSINTERQYYIRSFITIFGLSFIDYSFHYPKSHWHRHFIRIFYDESISRAIEYYRLVPDLWYV